MFSFIHTGDLHLDSPLTALGALEDERAADVAGASRRAFDQLVAIAVERKVDAFLIAGDLWDGDWSDVSVGFYMQDKARQLRDAGIGVFAVLGNHDAASAVTQRIRNLDALHLFGSEAPTSVECGDAVIHAISYATRDVGENLAARYPTAWPGRINIGLLHTSLDGSRGHGLYAPCTVGDLGAKEYDYFALGHVHTREVIRSGPAHAGGTIAYCGVLQGRHVRETGVKGAYHGTIGRDGVELTPIDLHHVAWFAERVDVSGGEPAAAIHAALGEVAASNRAPLALVRLVLTGVSEAHFRLRAERRALLDDARSAAFGIDGRLLVADVKVATQGPRNASLPRLPSHFEDLLHDAAGSSALRAEAEASVREVLNALPGEVRRIVSEEMEGLADFELRGELDTLLAEASATVAARMNDTKAKG